MEPAINPSKPLRLFDLGFDGFQRLCRAMLRELPGVVGAAIYGKNGQSQRGIDIEVTLDSGRLWLGQCKACESNSGTHIKKAVAEFLPHLGFWKEHGLEKFIVLVACGVDDRNVLDAKREYERDFAQRGVEFQLWDSDEIRRLLRPMRAVVEQFLSSWWVEEICGTRERISVRSGQGSNSQISVSPELLAELGATQNEHLDRIRELIRSGKETQAEAELRALPAKELWIVLPPNLQARVFRMMAGLALSRRSDVSEARAFFARAQAIYPSGRFVTTEATIRYYADGAVAALAEMPDPTDRDEWHLRIALLLNGGRVEEALLQLQAPAFDPDAETFRLRAVACLLNRDPESAKAAAQEAEARAADWLLVRETAALADYYSAISPLFNEWSSWVWPVPPNWRLVRSDAPSRAALSRAEHRFAGIAAEAEPKSFTWQRASCWQLACVANDSGRQIEAAELARRILATNPASVPAIVWAIERGFEFPHEPTRSLLEAECVADPHNIEPVQALFALMTSMQDYSGAGLFLEEHKTLYEESGLIGIYRFQRAQVWMANGDVEKANVLLSEQIDPDLQGRTRVALARIAAFKGGWTPELASVLDAEFRRSGSDEVLFDACEAHHFAGLPEYAAGKADELVRRFGTESALRLALDAALCAQRWQHCLDLMERHRALFRDANFPPAVRRLRVVCLRRLGRLLEAEQEMLDVTSESGLPSDRFQLFHLQLSTGRVAEAISTARSLLEDQSIPVEILLHIADGLRAEDRNLASAFFSQAAKRGIQSTEAAAFGVSVGFDLGLDDQLAPLLQKALSSVGEPDAPLKRVTFEQFLVMAREWDRNRSELESKYRRGELPIHLYANALREPLAVFFHLSLAANEIDEIPLSRRWSLRMRNASKWEQECIVNDTKHGLFLDITSLLLAMHLDVLDVLEANFDRIGISPRVMESLSVQIKQITAGQLSFIPAKKEVLELLDNGRIKTLLTEMMPIATAVSLFDLMGKDWCALVECAKTSEGWLVDFLPLRSKDVAHEIVEIPVDVSPFLRGPGDVLNSLLVSGALSADQEVAARQRLGDSAHALGGTIQLDRDKSLVLAPGLAEQLAFAGLLRPLANRIKIRVRAEEPAQLRRELSQIEHRERLTAWLRALRERLRAGLDAGRYREEPNPELVEVEPKSAASPEQLCLRDFLNLQRADLDLSCCDDRALSRITHLGKSRVIGLLDLLWFLNRRGKIESRVPDRALYRLRKGNARYIPLSTDEILRCVKSAGIDNMGIVENADLAILRRYYSSCLLDCDVFQNLPPTHPDALSSSELMFAARLHRTCVEAITALWQDPEVPESTRYAGSNWILESLWFDFAGLPTFFSHSAQPNVDGFGMSEAHLVLSAFSLKIGNGKPNSLPLQEAYLNWLFSRFGTKPRRITHLAPELKRYLLLLAREGRSSIRQQAMAAMSANFFQILPDSVGVALRFTHAELGKLGLEQFSPVSLGEIVFDGRKFWPAARQAMKEKTTRVKAKIPQGKSFRLRAETTARNPTIVVMGEDGIPRVTVRDSLLTLLRDSGQERLKALWKIRGEFDFGNTEARSVFPKLARIKRVNLRMRQALELRLGSCANQFRQIAEQLDGAKKFDITVAQPLGLKSLLRHLRLPLNFSDSDFRKHLEVAARILITEEGFQEAFERLSGLPVLLPEAIHEEFRSLPTSERNRLVELFDVRGCSPLLRFHGAELLLRGTPLEKERGLEALSFIASSASKPTWDLFNAVLNWAGAWLTSETEKIRPEPAPSLLAAWIHAARINQLLAGREGARELITLFRGHELSFTGKVFDRQLIWGSDAAHPRAFSRTRFLVVGLSHILVGIELTGTLRDRLKGILEVLCFPNSDSGLPHLRLLEQRSGTPNRLGSFLGNCNTDLLADIIGSEMANRFADATLENEVTGWLEQILVEPAKLEPWMCLAVYLHAQPATETQRPALRLALSALSFKKLVNPTFDQIQVIAMLGFSLSTYLSEPDEIPYWESKLIELADVLADPSGRFPVQASGVLIANCAFFVANIAPDEIESAHRFSELIARVAALWPAAAKSMARGFFRLLLSQPTAVHAVMWRGATQLRCAAD